MSLELAAVLALIVTCVIGFGICAFSRWHQKRFLRISYSEINAHKITPRFNVGSSCK